MPNPMVHVDFACQAARALDHPVLNGNVGYVALGATSPDIRVITKQPREAYHFAGLDFESVGAGVEGMARAHPELFDRARHDEATQAFLAGYVSHLAMDETWITEMYRPYFGNRQVFEDEVEGQVMDRALQLDLDRESRPAAAEKAPMIDAARTGASVSFIPGETLDEWCDWVIGLIGRPFTMDRLRFMASRIARWDDTHRANHIAEEFLSAFPGSMDRLHERVPRERVARFKALAVERLSETMAEFLS